MLQCAGIDIKKQYCCVIDLQNIIIEYYAYVLHKILRLLYDKRKKKKETSYHRMQTLKLNCYMSHIVAKKIHFSTYSHLLSRVINLLHAYMKKISNETLYPVATWPIVKKLMHNYLGVREGEYKSGSSLMTERISS
ncbi:hypothetical protein V1477_011166, partial [Vespula maculifrons]